MNAYEQTSRTLRRERRLQRNWPWALVFALSLPACGDDAQEPNSTSDTDNVAEEEDDSDRRNGDGSMQEGSKDSGATSSRRDAASLDAGSSVGRPDVLIDAALRGDGGAQVTDATSAIDTDPGGGTCTREGLKATIAQYFAALTAHDPAPLPAASNLKFTENAKELKLGEGFWTSAGASKFQRSLLDTERCGSLTQAVVDEAGKEVLFAVRLKLVDQKITEVETFLVKSGLFFQPSGVKDDGGADWETVLPAEQRSTREQLDGIADAYFESFMDSSVEVPYDTPCKRFEGGLMPVAHCSEGIPANTRITARRYPVADLEAGIAVGFVLFGGNLLDFHMFKVKSGKITGIQALVGPRASSSGWPEP